MITTVCQKNAHLIRMDVNNAGMWVDEDGSTRCGEGQFTSHIPPAKYLVLGMVMDVMTQTDDEVGSRTVTSLDYVGAIGRNFTYQVNQRASREELGRHHCPIENRS